MVFEMTIPENEKEKYELWLKTHNRASRGSFENKRIQLNDYNEYNSLEYKIALKKFLNKDKEFNNFDYKTVIKKFLSILKIN
jgi:hypothetical protein